MAWTLDDVPDLRGKTFIVTGANTGIGLETAAALAANGARAVLACRNLTKAAAARAEIESRKPRGTVEVLQLDLADQRQIAAAAQEALERFPAVDCLINNAGVMSPTFSRTVDGFEMSFGTNHLGHFAFTGRVLPALLTTPGARVVTVSSMSHAFGRIRWDDPSRERSYRKARAYAQSKLANLLFAFELQRRLVLARADTVSLAAHPGFASTDFLIVGAGATPMERLKKRLGTRLVQTAAEAARPSLRAATSPDAYGGQHYGPSGTAGIKGAPVVVTPARRSLDERAQARLWDLSVELTGVDYSPVSAPARV